MSKTPWTPGPWAVDEDPRPDMEWNRHIVVAADLDMRICFMAHSGGKEPERDEANGRLIAASPTMAEVLEKVTDWLEGLGIDAKHADRFPDETFSLVAEARTLLARIRGDAT